MTNIFIFFSGQLSKSCENQDFFKRLMTIFVSNQNEKSLFKRG